VCFVNFNYDILLDRACAAVWGRSLLDITSFDAESTASLVKPHGSAIWGWELAHGDRTVAWANPANALRSVEAVGTAQIAEGAQPFVLGHLLGPRDPDYSTTTQHRPVIPALALPVANKHEFVWPTEQNNFVEDLRARVNRVMLIGWRGLEPHFIDLLHRLVTPRHKTLVIRESEESAVAIAQRVHPSGRVESTLTRTEAGFFRFMQTDRQSLGWLLDHRQTVV
jgi:hypothetical protein